MKFNSNSFTDYSLINYFFTNHYVCIFHIFYTFCNFQLVFPHFHKSLSLHHLFSLQHIFPFLIFSLTFLAAFSVAYCNDDLGFGLLTYKFCRLPHFWWPQKFPQSQLFWPVFCPCEFISINENDEFLHGVHFIIFITRYEVTGAEIRPKLLQPRKFKQAAEFVS